MQQFITNLNQQQMEELYSDIITLNQLDQIERKINKNKNVIVDTQGTKYDLIKNVTEQFEYKNMDKQKDQAWNLKWYDYYINDDELRKMLPFQKINHFPSSHLLGKKNNLAKNLQKMQAIYPDQYNFFPKTWILPVQFENIRQHLSRKDIPKSQKILIAKPDSLCQGKGIFLFKKIEKIQNQQNMIVQQYISNPYLIGQFVQQLEGLKFDCRLYILLKNLDPLKIFLYREGLARFATQQFQKPTKYNINDAFMHLTNYAINKKSSQFVQNMKEDDQEKGHKRSFSSIISYLQSQGKNTQQLMEDIKQLITKTIAAFQPLMNHSYKSSRPINENLELCFEILGFDILIDNHLKPWLIEVNHTPSFCTESELDYKVKKNLITDTLILLNIENKDKKLYYKRKLQNFTPSFLSQQIQRQKENIQDFETQNLNGFLKIYPQEIQIEQIEKFINGAKQIWDNVALIKRYKIKDKTNLQKIEKKFQIKDVKNKNQSQKIIKTEKSEIKELKQLNQEFHKEFDIFRQMQVPLQPYKCQQHIRVKYFKPFASQKYSVINSDHQMVLNFESKLQFKKMEVSNFNIKKKEKYQKKSFLLLGKKYENNNSWFSRQKAQSTQVNQLTE